ncbi:hypothetical protein AAG906_035171 [Vitis piasezkii]
MAALLKQVSCFIEVEPLLIDMVNFFPLTKRVSANLGGNPPINSIVSRIQPMQDYSAHETKEMGGSEELRSKLARTNGDLPAAQKVVADRAEALRKTEGEREMA